MRVCSSVGQSNGLLSRGSGVRIPSSTLMVGMVQLVSAPDCGSGYRGFESHYPPLFFAYFQAMHDGLSPSGKAQDFDSCIRWFESNQPSNYYGALAQSVEHLTFNQVVRGSNPRCFTRTSLGLFFIYADVAELADALDLGSSGRPCRFDSCHPQPKSALFQALFLFVLHFVLHRLKIVIGFIIHF